MHILRPCGLLVVQGSLPSSTASGEDECAILVDAVISKKKRSGDALNLFEMLLHASARMHLSQHTWPHRLLIQGWGLKFLRFETLEQLARAQILQSAGMPSHVHVGFGRYEVQRSDGAFNPSSTLIEPPKFTNLVWAIGRFKNTLNAEGLLGPQNPRF